MKHRLTLCFVLFFITSVSFRARAAEYALQKIADGLLYPTAIVQPPGDASRLFVVDLQGKISIIQNGTVLEEPFLDVSADISITNFGEGLHNLAFHPDYVNNGFFYVVYTTTDGDGALVRYTVSADDPNKADPASKKIIFIIPHPYDFHYGGGLAFGPDGDLYWSMGDGAQGKANPSPAQKLDSYLGAIVRLDVDGGDPYRVPPDNPYLNNPDALPELWAKGLRNPWRFSFDRETGDLYIADVGEGQYEEINFQPANSPGGENYGWNYFEGDAPFKGQTDAETIFPAVEYPHDNGSCSITGGYVYRGHELPDLTGEYIFGDYCSGQLWTTFFQYTGDWYTAELLDTSARITTFGEDNAGEIYVGDARTHAVYKLVAAS